MTPPHGQPLPKALRDHLLPPELRYEGSPSSGMTMAMKLLSTDSPNSDMEVSRAEFVYFVAVGIEPGPLWHEAAFD